MTRSEKFKEVFGIKPDEDCCPLDPEDCPRRFIVMCCGDCDVLNGWWTEEYIEGDVND